MDEGYPAPFLRGTKHQHRSKSPGQRACELSRNHEDLRVKGYPTPHGPRPQLQEERDEGFKRMSGISTLGATQGDSPKSHSPFCYPVGPVIGAWIS
jgi:hypothetical protein